MDELDLQYDVSLDDVVELHVYEARRAGTLRRALRSRLIFWTAILGGMGAWFFHKGMDGSVAALLGFFMALIVVAILALIPTGIRKEVRRSVIRVGGTFPKRIEARVTDRGFLVTSAEGVATSVPWRLVQAPIIGKGYVAIPLQSHSPIFIPRRAFASNEAQDSFMGRIQDFRKRGCSAEEEKDQANASRHFPPLPNAPGSASNATNRIFFYLAVIGSLAPIAAMVVIHRSYAGIHAPASSALPGLAQFIGDGWAVLGSMLTVFLLVGGFLASTRPKVVHAVMFGAAALGLGLIVLSVFAMIEPLT